MSATDGSAGRHRRLFLHFDHGGAGPAAGAVRLDGGGARPARRAERPAARAAGTERLRPRRSRRGTERRRRDGRTRGQANIACRLVIAAEGRESPMREAAGIPVTRLPYRQTSIVCAIATNGRTTTSRWSTSCRAAPSRNCRWRSPTPRRRRRNVSAIVWTERARHRRAHAGAGRHRFAAEIARRLGDHLGAMRPSAGAGAIRCRRCWRTATSIRGSRWWAMPRTASIRSPARASICGFRDAIALCRPGDRGAWSAAPIPVRRRCSRAISARRRPDNLRCWRRPTGSTAVQQRQPLLRSARDIGIAAVHRMPPLKRSSCARRWGWALPAWAERPILPQPATGGSPMAPKILVIDNPLNAGEVMRELPRRDSMSSSPAPTARNSRRRCARPNTSSASAR